MYEDKEPDYRQLKVPLNNRELRRKGQELAGLLQKSRRVKADAASAAAKANSDLKDIAAKIDRMSVDIENQYEYRMIEVKNRRVPEFGVIEIIRLDTLDVIDTRPMTSAERQERLFPAEELPGAAEQTFAVPATAPQADEQPAETAPADEAAPADDAPPVVEDGAAPQEPASQVDPAWELVPDDKNKRHWNDLTDAELTKWFTKLTNMRSGDKIRVEHGLVKYTYWCNHVRSIINGRDAAWSNAAPAPSRKRKAGVQATA